LEFFNITPQETVVSVTVFEFRWSGLSIPSDVWAFNLVMAKGHICYRGLVFGLHV